jgi:hypothetical protein
MPGSDLNITLPVVGTDSWPVWADGITSALTTLINDIEAPIVTSEILENADHDFNGFALVDARWLTFRSGNTTNLPTYGIGFKSGDLYACDSAGNQIQITSGGQLAGVGNGFRGDTAYAKYTASSNLYEFLDSGNAYDSIKADDVIVANGSTASATIGFGGTVNTSFTLPATAAAGVSVLTIDAAGQVAHNATIGVGFTVNNADITLTGTAEVVYPDTSATRRAAACKFRETGGPGVTTVTGMGELNFNGAWVPYFAGDAETDHVGNRLKSIAVVCDKGDASLTTLTVYRVSARQASVPAAIAAGTDSTSGTNRTITATVGSPAALAAGESIVCSLNFASGNNTVYSVKFTWDHP